jgi:hypothetical protein
MSGFFQQARAALWHLGVEPSTLARLYYGSRPWNGAETFTFLISNDIKKTKASRIKTGDVTP